MKFAFMSFSCPDLTFDQMVAAAARYGYAGIEPRTASNHAHGVELSASPGLRVQLRRRAADAGIALCCLALSCRYADPVSAEEQIQESRRYLDLAADLGIPRVRVFGGRIPDGVGREDAVGQVGDALAALAEDAADRQIHICLETHDDWCDPRHVAQVMRQVGHPAVGVNWDVLHPLRVVGISFEEAYEILAPWIGHVHVHDCLFQEDAFSYVAMGSGRVDHAQVIRILHGAGYGGYLSGEWIHWEPHELHLPRELAQLQAYVDRVTS